MWLIIGTRDICCAVILKKQHGDIVIKVLPGGIVGIWVCSEINKTLNVLLFLPTKVIQVFDQYFLYSFNSSPASLGGFDTSEHQKKTMSLRIIVALPKA